MDTNPVKPTTNPVKNRFLQLTESVQQGLEQEAKISDFESLVSLGSGSFGKVYSATHKTTKAVYAIKEIDKKNKNNQEGKPYFRREIEIMYKVHHPNVVRLFSHFEDDNNCYFVMEYIPKGNLYELAQKQKSKCFEAKTVALLMKDLISAIYYLHNMNPPIIHRDIKPENVLLTEDGRLKLTDFGWSNYVDDNEVRSTYCGTPVYLAPEMIKEIGHDEHLDIWCIGVLMFELLTGQAPFPGNTMQNLSENILRLKINWPKDINLDAKSLISKILKPDPKDRISLADMMKHSFFTKYLSNPVDYLVKPADTVEAPFILGEDIPKAETKKTAVKPIATSNKTILNSTNQTTTDIKGNAYEDIQPNFKDLYEKLKREYEAMTTDYHALVHAKSDVNKNNDDLNYKEIALKNQKEQLLKELDDRENEKLQMTKTNADLQQKIKEKDERINSLTKAMMIAEEKKKKEQEEIKRLNLEIEDLTFRKEQDAKEFKEKIAELQSNIVKDDNLDHQMTNFRNSLSDMNDTISRNNKTETNDDMIAKMENDLKSTKELFSQEIDNLRKESAKEKDKFSLILKNKDEEIKKLQLEQNLVKENEAKKYQMLINRYEMNLKLKESEVENLQVKVKRMENIISTFNIKK